MPTAATAAQRRRAFDRAAALSKDSSVVCEFTATMITRHWSNENLTRRCMFCTHRSAPDLMGDGAPCLFEYSDKHDSIRTFCANGYNANKDALTQSLFLNSDDVDFTDPYARGFRTSEVRKPLKELTTDFTSLFFFEKKQCRITFLKLIIQVFKCFCENIVGAHDRHGLFKDKWSDYCNVMFKGGVVIRLALLSCSRNILKRNAASALDKKLKKYLKVSDFDFGLMVSPQICSDNRILTKIMHFAYMTTLKVRQVLRKNNAGYISFFTLSQVDKEKRVCRLAAKVSEWIKGLTEENPYFGLELQGVGYKTVDEKEVVYWTQRKHTDKSIYKDIVTFLTDSADERKAENSQTKVDFVTCGLH